MRLQIDISDAAIEENEELHQLHLWGAQTSLWKNNCIVCGGDTDATRIRCPCGEGVLCSRTCEKHPRAVPLGQCRFMSFNPLKDRPSSNHRRIIIFGSEPPYLTLTWAEVKDSHLIIDHPTFDAYYGGSRTGAFWLDLAVINPAVHTELFRKIGHGIAIGFSAAMMDGGTVVEARWRNMGVRDTSGPGYSAQWPGPLVFFSYGYGLSDYVKVSPTQSDDVEHGAEANMTKLEIWKELDKMRWESTRAFLPKDTLQWRGAAASKSATRCPKMVWKWKVKEHGTSMKILDLTHKDLGTCLDYLANSQLNPLPCLPKFWNLSTIPAIHIQDLNHPGYGLKDLWKQCGPEAQSACDTQANQGMKVESTKGERVSIRNVMLPSIAFPMHPMLAAFAVGLQWMVHYSMDINPPFREQIPRADAWPIMDLLWTVGLSEDEPYVVLLSLPTSSCDSAVVVQAERAHVYVHHVRALYKYLRHTDPREWARRGPKGFENYWAVYSKVEMDSETRETVPHVYSASDTLPSMGYVVDDGIATVMAHMTLEGLSKKDLARKKEIAKIRADLLSIVYSYRRASPGRGFVETD